MKATKRDLVGRKIVGVEWRRVETGRAERPWTTDPVLVLDNGRRVWFTVVETEYAEYGIEISISDRKKKISPPSV